MTASSGRQGWKGIEDVIGYAVIIERGEMGYGAYVPELPGLGAARDSIEEVERLIYEAIPLHLESLRAHGDPVPPPSQWPPSRRRLT